MSNKLINPATLYDGAPVGMSQARVDLRSGLIFVSGQVDWDRESRVRHSTLEGQAGDTISLLPLAGDARGVTTRGLRYPLDDATLSFERARGVSNVLLDPPGHVRLREGLLLLVHSASEGVRG